jgi:hypothetical protein
VHRNVTECLRCYYDLCKERKGTLSFPSPLLEGLNTDYISTSRSRKCPPGNEGKKKTLRVFVKLPPNYLLLPPAYVYLSLHSIMFFGSKVWPVCGAENLASICEPIA